jgi:hypothetical protein
MIEISKEELDRIMIELSLFGIPYDMLSEIIHRHKVRCKKKAKAKQIVDTALNLVKHISQNKTK